MRQEVLKRLEDLEAKIDKLLEEVETLTANTSGPLTMDEGWEDAPSYHEWIAMDSDGHVYTYANKPTLTTVAWDGKDYASVFSQSLPFYYTGSDWKDSLRKRP